MAPIAPLKIIVAPAAKAIAKIGSTMTYDDVPCIVDERNDSCPYRAMSPTLRPSSLPIPEHREQQPQMHRCRAARGATLLVHSNLSPFAPTPGLSMLRPRRDTRRDTSPNNTPITTPARMGSLAISAGEPLSGTIVAIIESTSSTTGIASAAASTLPRRAHGTHASGGHAGAGAKTPGTSGYSS